MTGDNLGYWIEVTTGFRWQRMLNEGEIKLEAPNKTRYQTFFKKMKPGDIVLHYVTGLVPFSWEGKKSCIVAVSKVPLGPQLTFGSIVAKCSGTLHLPRPILYKDIENIENKSEGLEKLLRISMRGYLTNITESDFKSLIEIYPQNRKVVEKFMKSKA